MMVGLLVIACLDTEKKMIYVLISTNVQKILACANVQAALIQLAIISVNALQLPLKGSILLLGCTY